MLVEIGWLSSQTVWLIVLAGFFTVVRLVLGPLADLVSQRLGGLLRLAATVLLIAGFGMKVFDFLGTNAGYGVSLLLGALALAAFGFKPIKLMFAGDMLKAAGVFREGDYVVIDGQTARVTEVAAMHTVLVTS
ncbi:MAG: hypothetical protein QW614_04525, partial [Candidatus Caldarchaeum sp.]